MADEAPLYTLEAVRKLIDRGMIRLATDKCWTNTQELGLTTQTVGVLIRQLDVVKHFRSVYGPAETNFGTFPADDYLACVDVDRLKVVAEGEGLKVYIKFAIAATQHDGTQVLVVSFHKEKRPRF